MQIIIDNRFVKDFRNIRDKNLKREITAIVDEIKEADSLSEVSELKFLEGHKNLFRIRYNNYRLAGKVFDDGLVKLIHIRHRETIYESFP